MAGKERLASRLGRTSVSARGIKRCDSACVPKLTMLTTPALSKKIGNALGTCRMLEKEHVKPCIQRLLKSHANGKSLQDCLAATCN
eukprot:scaffold143139_cov19-Tisochrysis_lutea.AAC.5